MAITEQLDVETESRYKNTAASIQGGTMSRKRKWKMEVCALGQDCAEPRCMVGCITVWETWQMHDNEFSIGHGNEFSIDLPLNVILNA